MYYDKAILAFENYKDISYTDYISLLNDKALNLIDMGNYQEAERILLKIISDTKNRQNLDSFLIPVFNNLARIYEANGSLTKAESYLIKGLEIFEKNSEFSFQAKLAYANLSRVYARQTNFKKAKIYLDKAIDLENDFFNGDPKKFIQTIFVLNTIYLRELQEDDFIKTSLWILDTIENSENPETFDEIYISTLLNIGDYYYVFEIRRSRIVLHRSLQDTKKYNTKTYYYYRMSQIYLTRNDLLSAEKPNEIINELKNLII